MTTATRKQQKMFFALCDEGKWDKKAVEARAIKIYNLESFADITSEQIAPLIDGMMQQIKAKKPAVEGIAEKLATYQMINRKINLRIYNKKEKQMQYNTYTHSALDKNVIMYFPFGYSMGNKNPQPEEMTMREGTGKFDINENELYQFDIFINSKRETYIVDWSYKDLCWIAFNVETEEPTQLSLFTKVRIIGNLDEGLQPEPVSL